MELKDVEKLAELARLDLSTEEKEAFLNDLGGILAYVNQVSEVTADTEEEHLLTNVMRDDENPHDSSQYREAILNEFPDRDGDFLKVKQIL